MKTKNKNSYDMNISFLGEIQDHQIDDNFMRLLHNVGVKLKNEKIKGSKATRKRNFK